MACRASRLGGKIKARGAWGAWSLLRGSGTAPSFVLPTPRVQIPLFQARRRSAGCLLPLPLLFRSGAAWGCLCEPPSPRHQSQFGWGREQQGQPWGAFGVAPFPACFRECHALKATPKERGTGGASAVWKLPEPVFCCLPDVRALGDCLLAAVSKVDVGRATKTRPLDGLPRALIALPDVSLTDTTTTRGSSTRLKAKGSPTSSTSTSW